MCGAGTTGFSIGLIGSTGFSTGFIGSTDVENKSFNTGHIGIFTSAADTTPAFEPAETGRSPEENARAGESRRYVAEALKNLPAEFRMPVVLRDLEEWSYEEIATSLELPVGTVKSRISRGRGQLKALLRPLMDSGKI